MRSATRQRALHTLSSATPPEIAHSPDNPFAARTVSLSDAWRKVAPLVTRPTSEPRSMKGRQPIPLSAADRQHSAFAIIERNQSICWLLSRTR